MRIFKTYRSCAVCGIDFLPTSSRGIVCSNLCRKERVRRVIETRVCGYCGRPFDVIAEHPRNILCSRSCVHGNNRLDPELRRQNRLASKRRSDKAHADTKREWRRKNADRERVCERKLGERMTINLLAARSLGLIPRGMDRRLAYRALRDLRFICSEKPSL